MDIANTIRKKTKDKEDWSKIYHITLYFVLIFALEKSGICF